MPIEVILEANDGNIWFGSVGCIVMMEIPLPTLKVRGSGMRV